MMDLKSLMQFHTDVINESFSEISMKASQVYIVYDKDTKNVIIYQINLDVKVTDLKDSSRRYNFWFDELLQAQAKDWRRNSLVKFKSP